MNCKNDSPGDQKEEVINAVTHGIGTCLAMAGLVILIILAVSKGTTWHVVSFSVFGATMVLLYLVSTLYHSFTSEKLKNLFRKFDHMAIFLLIAGTYTPFCLSLPTGLLRWIILGTVWGCTLLGIILKVFFTGKKDLLSTILYLALGWLAIIVMKPLYDYMSLEGFSFLIAGGIFYTLGTIFYVKHQIRYNHGIWHLFVLSGTTFHFFSILTLL
ncbi:PAQR family membrane homeostasis protein TrhA [Fulvivirga imtechensis]|nr:hemolysin III family protein [Fulvivirga imtechensis]